MAVKAPSDKRFRRARVQPPRKRRSWRRLVAPALRGALAVAIVGYAAFRGVALVTAAPALNVSAITVHGVRQLPAREVIDRVRGLRGQNIVTADLERWRAELLKWAWVREASFRRVLPSTVEIVIAEREPIGIGRLGDRLYLVSGDGMILDPYTTRYADYELPIIDGLHVGPTRAGLLVDDVRAGLAARVIHGVGRHRDLAGRLAQVDVSDDEDAVVMLDDDSARVHLGHEQFAERLRAYLELAPTLRTRVRAIDYVDLRYDARVFVRPVSATRR
jgi:cell division septal protein FtsQ